LDPPLPRPRTLATDSVKSNPTHLNVLWCAYVRHALSTPFSNTSRSVQFKINSVKQWRENVKHTNLTVYLDGRDSEHVTRYLPCRPRQAALHALSREGCAGRPGSLSASLARCVCVCVFVVVDSCGSAAPRRSSYVFRVKCRQFQASPQFGGSGRRGGGSRCLRAGPHRRFSVS